MPFLFVETGTSDGRGIDGALPLGRLVDGGLAFGVEKISGTSSRSASGLWSFAATAAEGLRWTPEDDAEVDAAVDSNDEFDGLGAPCP